MLDVLSMEESVSQNIMMSVLFATRAFKDVEIEVNSHTNIILVRVVLKPFWKKSIFSFLRRVWIYRAESRAIEYVPTGWRILISYGSKKRVVVDNS